MNYKVIFLVDDNPTTTFYNTDVISEYSPESKVVSFENPNEFIELYLSDYAHQADDSLLLLDINMPQKLGYEVLEELEEKLDELNNLHVLMVTSSNLRSDLEKSSRFLSVVGYIEKPLTVEKLNKALSGDFQA